MATCRPGGAVLDPFAGAGTTGLVARRRGLSFIGIELNPAYAAMAERRIAQDEAPGTYVDKTSTEPLPLFGGA